MAERTPFPNASATFARAGRSWHDFSEDADFHAK
jgi:hypothetical protein